MQIDIPGANGNGTWKLPVPATYLVDRSGTIRFAHLEVDWRERADPDDVLAHCAALSDPQP
jgi:peroxiredoxin